MPYTPKGKAIMLAALAPDEVSLHDGDPGTDGANELDGGDYARQPIEWNVPAGGAMDDKSDGVDFPTPAESAVRFVGYWKGGDFVASDEVDEETFNKGGTYTLEDADLHLNAA